MSKPYKILTAQNFTDLESLVAIHISHGYVPAGGPFNANYWTACGDVAQAVVLHNAPAVIGEGAVVPMPKQKRAAAGGGK